MSESDKNLVRAMLRAARYPERDIGWMTDSCPSVQRCREVCGEHMRAHR